MSRAAKRLETCPGVRETSASGKIMRSIPDLWKGKKEPLQDVKLEDLADQASAKMAAGNGSIAGLLGHNSTFSFSPLKRSDGKCIISDTFFVMCTIITLFSPWSKRLRNMGDNVIRQKGALN